MRKLVGKKGRRKVWNLDLFNKLEFIEVEMVDYTAPISFWLQAKIVEYYSWTFEEDAKIYKKFTICYTPEYASWGYYDHIASNGFNQNNLTTLGNLRDTLIVNAKSAKIEYYATAHKNLNLVRDKLHPDVVPYIVRMINDLRQSHYLDSV